MRYTAYLFMINFLIGMTGCTSFNSTPITRLDNNGYSGDSNGRPTIFRAARPHRGIPVRVKVQTHMDVFIEENYCLRKDPRLGPVEPLQNVRLYQVRAAPVLSEQVIIVDFKRPAAGTLDLSIDMNDEEYFKAISSQLTDETIKKSAELANTILKNFSLAPDAPLVNTDEFEWKTRTVAYQRFDINACDYEAQLEAFVNHHLNDCHQCSGPPTYDR